MRNSLLIALELEMYAQVRMYRVFAKEHSKSDLTAWAVLMALW